MTDNATSTPRGTGNSADAAPLLSLVYSSQAVIGFDLRALDALLEHARASNEAAGVTELLLFKDPRFLHLLEGPERTVREKMRLIVEDARHHEVTVLLEEHVPTRQCPEWTMGYAAHDTLRHVDASGYRTTFDDIDFIPHDHQHRPAVPALHELIRWFRAQRPNGDIRDATNGGMRPHPDQASGVAWRWLSRVASVVRWVAVRWNRRTVMTVVAQPSPVVQPITTSVNLCASSSTRDAPPATTVGVWLSRLPVGDT